MRVYLLFLITLLCLNCKNNTEKKEENKNPAAISLLSKEEKMTLVSVGNKSPNGLLKDIDEAVVEISSFKGKLLVIDFWATWCAPCITETPIFKDIADTFKDTNAVFISVSVDQDFEHWKNYLIENNWEGNNYWFGMQEEAPLFSFLYSKVKMDDALDGANEMILMVLPTYIIIAPDGTILDSKDLRPSNPGFKDAITGYLKAENIE